MNAGLQWTAVACQWAGPDTGEHKGASFSFISTSTSICQVTQISDLAEVKGGKSLKNPHGGVVVAILNIWQTVKIMSVLSRFDGKPLKSPDWRHSSHSAGANAIRPVNQAIKFNLAHLSTPGLPTEALCLRMQNEAREPPGLQGTVMFYGG